MINETNVMPCDGLWVKMVHEILQNGGSVWVVERTDTNEMMIRDSDFSIRTSNDPPVFANPYKWRKDFPISEDGMFYGMMIDLYPTRELADKYAPKTIKEGGCRCCGNGSVEIPIRIAEHQFVNQQP